MCLCMWMVNSFVKRQQQQTHPIGLECKALIIAWFSECFVPDYCKHGAKLKCGYFWKKEIKKWKKRPGKSENENIIMIFEITIRI